MGAPVYERFDALLSHGDTPWRLAERSGSYRVCMDRHVPADPGASPTWSFRATWADGESRVDGVEPFLHHPGFALAARSVHRRALVRPFRVEAKLLLPGQPVPVHTDAPEFRGIDADGAPRWLPTVMHHAGLFDAWRTRIATAVAWFGVDREDCAFAFYPEGPYGPPVGLPLRHNTAILLDAESVFHGVDRMRDEGPLPGPEMRLRWDDGAWSLRERDREVGRFGSEDLRLQLAWKARCHRDEEEERRSLEGRDPITAERALETLLGDLRRRGRIDGVPGDDALGRTLMAAYVPFPPAAAG